MRVGQHGGDAGAIAEALGIDRASLIDLSMSMNPVAPDVATVLADQLDAIADYPDATRATVALADAIGTDPERLVVTNGGAEAIALVAGTMDAGDVRDPEFSLYRRHLDVVVDGAPRWRSNPSNPLGWLAAADESAAVWDEAFWPLATGTWTNRLLDDDDVWRLGSLTKLWACPGLRLGYVIAPDVAAAAGIRERQPRWSVGSLALSVIDPLLSLTDLTGWQSTIVRLRGDLASEIGDCGFSVVETEANWLLVENAPGLRDALIAHRVVVRDCANFGLSGTTRIAVPRVEEFRDVVRAFQRVASELV